MDGKRQRSAVTAVENTIRALGVGDAERAAWIAATAAERDQLGIFADLPDAVAVAVEDLGAGGAVSASSWERIAQVVGPGPLLALVAEARSGP